MTPPSYSRESADATSLNSQLNHRRHLPPPEKVVALFHLLLPEDEDQRRNKVALVSLFSVILSFLYDHILSCSQIKGSRNLPAVSCRLKNMPKYVKLLSEFVKLREEIVQVSFLC